MYANKTSQLTYQERSSAHWIAASGSKHARAVSFFSKVVLIVLLVAMTLLVAGLFRFQSEINRLASSSVPPSADGIAILTGGADRIETGLELFEGGKADRLLISGVHGSTSRRAILAVNGRKDVLEPCCIDIGHLAKNTIGNAEEIADWARINRFKHLIVVTSDYHLPRSMLELESVLQTVKLSPYAPKESSKKESDRSLRLLMREYGKYLIAWVRLTFIETNPLTRIAGLG